MRLKNLHFSEPDIGEEEFKQVKAVMESGWLTTGPVTRKFEEEFASAVGAQFAVAVNSCTASLHLVIDAIGLKCGDEVITTPYTFAATAEVLHYLGIKPVFVDIDQETLTIDPELVEEAISRRTRLILPVHIGGLAPDLDPIYEIAANNGIGVVEDAAHGFPSEYKGRQVGSTPKQMSNLPHSTCFSFYSTKTITTAGEGGMICTDSKEIAEICRLKSLHGIARNAWHRRDHKKPWEYDISCIGYKYNMTDLTAAFGLAQIKKAERMRERRSEIAARYSQVFQEFDEIKVPFCSSEYIHSWHLYMLRLNLEMLSISRAEFIEELNERKIGTSVHFIPLHLHSFYQKTYNFDPQDFPVSNGEYQREVSLPIYSRMSSADVEDVIEAVSDVIAKFRKKR
jgi:dTDP-4-amino-4,6-dideoxygalactose transaminase